VKPVEEILTARESQGEAKDPAIDTVAVKEWQEVQSGGEATADFEQNSSQKAEKKLFEILCIYSEAFEGD